MTRDDRLAYGSRSTPIALTLFGGLALLYLATAFAILALPSGLSMLLSLPCGFLIAILFVVGHDASHQSFTDSRTVNHWLARLAFLPSLHPNSQWDVVHNRVHHRFNNIRGKDYVWEPMAPEDYASASLIRRLAYRWYRFPLGVFCYYLPEFWIKRMIVPRPAVVGRIRAVHVFDTALVWAFGAVQICAVAWIGSLFGKTVAESLLWAVLVPFLIWNALMSFVIYLHHMHPSVRWYSSIDEWKHDQGSIKGTVHVQFPLFMRRLILHIMEHAAHHFFPGAPLYRLAALQEKMSGEVAVTTWQFTIPAFIDVCSQCKLFDYDRKMWVTFTGQPHHQLATAGLDAAKP
jgi:omega-6 fatty acid desaturase (delta-12 desaturase)